MTHRHIFFWDIFYLFVPMERLLQSGFAREMTNSYVFGEVIDFVFPDFHTPRRSLSSLDILHWNGCSLRTGQILLRWRELRRRLLRDGIRSPARYNLLSGQSRAVIAVGDPAS